MQDWLNTREGNFFIRDAKSRQISSLHLICLLTIFALLQSVSAQSLDTTTRLTPWPPPGWPEGAQGEVRLVLYEEERSEEGDTGIAFPVGEAGEVTYRFPENLPRRANRLYAPINLGEGWTLCEGVSANLSPPDVEVVPLLFDLYADGEAWGFVKLAREQGDVLAEILINITYARAPLRLGGGGACAATLEAIYDVDLQEGPNLIVVAYDFVAAGTTTMTMTTRETLELPSVPVGFEE